MAELSPNLYDPGLRTGVPWSAYRQYGALSQSDLCTLARSPLEFMHKRKHPDGGQTDAMLLGTAIHTAVLEPEKFKATYAIGPTNDRRKKEWKDWAGEVVDQVVLTRDQGAKAKAIAASIALRPYVNALLHHPNAKHEATLTWMLKDGTRCKGRVDCVIEPLDVIVDLKSTREVSSYAFARAMATYKMHVQAAWYLQGYRKLTGREASYYVVAYDQNEPHPSAVYRMSKDAIIAGEGEISFLLDLHGACIASGQWLDRSEFPTELGLPIWYDPDFAQLAGLRETLKTLPAEDEVS